MDENNFRAFLKQKKKPKNTINSYITRTRMFEKYLSSKNPPKGLENATREDIKDFALVWGKEQDINVYLHLWGIQSYYLFLNDIDLYNTVNEMKEWVQLEKARLNDFDGINKEYNNKLSSVGIRTGRQMLEEGSTQSDRTALANQSGVPVDYILELVKLSNLARIGGLKKKRARLFYDAGFDTLDRISAKDIDMLMSDLDNYIKKTGFQGRGVSQSEAKHTISMAKFLQRIVKC